MRFSIGILYYYLQVPVTSLCSDSRHHHIPFTASGSLLLSPTFKVLHELGVQVPDLTEKLCLLVHGLYDFLSTSLASTTWKYLLWRILQHDNKGMTSHQPISPICVTRIATFLYPIQFTGPR